MPSAREEDTNVTLQLTLERPPWSKAVTRLVQEPWKIVPQQYSSKIKKEFKKEGNIRYTSIKIVMDDYAQEKCILLEKKFKCNYYEVLGRFSFDLQSLTCTALHSHFILSDLWI